MMPQELAQLQQYVGVNGLPSTSPDPVTIAVPFQPQPRQAAGGGSGMARRGTHRHKAIRNADWFRFESRQHLRRPKAGGAANTRISESRSAHDDPAARAFLFSLIACYVNPREGEQDTRNHGSAASAKLSLAGS